MATIGSRREQRMQAAGPPRGEIRERQILDATEHLLSQKPFADLTMDDIARQAGLSRSALYFYFASKEAVLGGLHQRTYEQMARTTEPITGGNEPTRAAMRDAVDLVGQNWRAHPHALRSFHETAMVSPEFGGPWRQRLERHVTALASIIEREREAGRARPGPPTARAIASAWFWMLETQFYELFRREHTRAEEVELVDTLTELWFRAIGSDRT